MYRPERLDTVKHFSSYGPHRFATIPFCSRRKQPGLGKQSVVTIRELLLKPVAILSRKCPICLIACGSGVTRIRVETNDCAATERPDAHLPIL
jgi:hypothetical protein